METRSASKQRKRTRPAELHRHNKKHKHDDDDVEQETPSRPKRQNMDTDAEEEEEEQEQAEDGEGGDEAESGGGSSDVEEADEDEGEGGGGGEIDLDQTVSTVVALYRQSKSKHRKSLRAAWRSLIRAFCNRQLKALARRTAAQGETGRNRNMNRDKNKMGGGSGSGSGDAKATAVADRLGLFAPWAMSVLPRGVLHGFIEAEFSPAQRRERPAAGVRLARSISRDLSAAFATSTEAAEDSDDSDTSCSAEEDGDGDEQAGEEEELCSREQLWNVVLLFFGVKAARSKSFWAHLRDAIKDQESAAGAPDDDNDCGGGEGEAAPAALVGRQGPPILQLYPLIVKAAVARKEQAILSRASEEDHDDGGDDDDMPDNKNKNKNKAKAKKARLRSSTPRQPRVIRAGSLAASTVACALNPDRELRYSLHLDPGDVKVAREQAQGQAARARKRSGSTDHGGRHEHGHGHRNPGSSPATKSPASVPIRVTRVRAQLTHSTKAITSNTCAPAPAPAADAEASSCAPDQATTPDAGRGPEGRLSLVREDYSLLAAASSAAATPTDGGTPPPSPSPDAGFVLDGHPSSPDETEPNTGGPPRDWPAGRAPQLLQHRKKKGAQVLADADAGADGDADGNGGDLGGAVEAGNDSDSSLSGLGDQGQAKGKGKERERGNNSRQGQAAQDHDGHTHDNKDKGGDTRLDGAASDVQHRGLDVDVGLGSGVSTPTPKPGPSHESASSAAAANSVKGTATSTTTGIGFPGSDSRRRILAQHHAGRLDSAVVLFFLAWAASHRPEWRVADPLSASAPQSLGWQTAEQVLVPVCLAMDAPTTGARAHGDADAQADAEPDHWALVHVDVPRNSATCHSSLPISQNFLDRARQRTRAYFGPAPQQNNAHDCGVFVIVMAMRILCGAPVDAPIDAQLTRRWMDCLLVAAAAEGEGKDRDEARVDRAPEVPRQEQQQQQQQRRLHEGLLVSDDEVEPKVDFHLSLPAMSATTLEGLMALGQQLARQQERAEEMARAAASRALRVVRDKSERLGDLGALLRCLASSSSTAAATIQRTISGAEDQRRYLGATADGLQRYNHKMPALEQTIAAERRSLSRLISFWNENARIVAASSVFTPAMLRVNHAALCKLSSAKQKLEMYIQDI
ncbi:hypothetical protein UCDDA912_g10723 [Diaporthe ampelina]|uniref:Ubiquitin-like protease family profile domain-containing protein n=1 Tax=Diaporthe ampelina TaxID=1214573 RepID=A0A0G2F563_9PEZI|nr:hypothetical protein UCDDA912_g10723 [Diaporthe ampelina]